MDIFNRKALKAQQNTIEYLRSTNLELTANIAEKKSRADSSTFTFYFDKDLVTSMETDVNPNVVDKLVAEGYLAERDISNEDAIHLAFVLIANEVTESIIEQYEGRMVDEVDSK